MPRAELDAMAPADLARLVRAWEDREMRVDFRAAQICRAMAGGKPGDYFASLAELGEGVLSDDEMERKLDSLVTARPKG